MKINSNSALERLLTADQAGFRKTLEYLWSGEPHSVKYLLYIVKTFKRYREMLNWLVANEVKGKKLIDLFKNESPDGGGYLMGCTYIMSRMDGKKYTVQNIKANELK